MKKKMIYILGGLLLLCAFWLPYILYRHVEWFHNAEVASLLGITGILMFAGALGMIIFNND